MRWPLILLYVFSCASVTYVLTRGFIFEGMKYKLSGYLEKYQRAEMYFTGFIYCPMCIGFWVGLVSELITGVFSWYYGWFGILLSAGAVSFASVLLDTTITTIAGNGE